MEEEAIVAVAETARRYLPPRHRRVGKEKILQG